MAGRHANWCLMSQKCGHFHKKKRWSGMKMTECFHGLTFSLDTDHVGSLKECTAENKGIFLLLLSFSLLSVVQIKLQWLIYTSFKSLSVHVFTPYKPKPISDRFKRYTPLLFMRASQSEQRKKVGLNVAPQTYQLKWLVSDNGWTEGLRYNPGEGLFWRAKIAISFSRVKSRKMEWKWA